MAEYRSTKNLKTEDAAYLAGLIDGEGTITLTRRNKNKQRALVISIANTELSLLECPLQLTGVGKITAKRRVKAVHAPSWTYQVSGRQALDLIQQILPYLRSYKRLRAELILKNYIRLTPRNGRYTVDQLKERSMFIDSFFSLRANESSLD